MTTKVLKPKNMRRLALLSVLAAPIIYLFGGLFTGLVGAHGEIVFADELNYVESSNELIGAPYRLDWDSVYTPVTNEINYYFDFECNGVEYSRIRMTNQYYGYYTKSTGAWTHVGNSNAYINQNFATITFVYDGSISLSSLSERGTLFIGSGSKDSYQNADFVFGQMFPEDNFVSKIGEDVFTGDINSQPICQLIQFADSNMFDIEQYSWGKFLYGYVYYAFTSVLIYEIVSIALSLLLMPLKVVDTLEERIHTS